MRASFPIVVMMCGVAVGQTSQWQPIGAFALKEDGLAIRRKVEMGKPFTVAGARGLIAGQQDGTFEAWVLPVKMLSHFTIRADVEGYPVPIDLNADAAEIEVFPDHTVITYSHIAFTIRQIMFAPDDAEDGTGAVVLFQIDAIRPMELTFSLVPEMQPMWPQRSQGLPSAEWVKQDLGGFYLLHTDFPNLAGAIGMPGGQPGVMAPYQEKPHFHPLELRLHYDPKQDGDRYFPLLMAVGSSVETASNTALQAKLSRMQATLTQQYAVHAARYQRMEDSLTEIRTPDTGLNDDLAWAEVSIEQLKARAQPSGEIGLVAGYYSSGDSARPGFGWYFGRDTLYSLYAVNGFGDFGLTREALEFLMKRQRDDGKIMHEYPQTAAYFDWKAFEYAYAAADSTPLFLTAMQDYVRSSGDLAFLRQHREIVEKAWRFETTHDADGDGIYDNSQGTGWVESWPTGMPHQEIYLGLLDQQASVAMSKLAGLLGDRAAADSAGTRAVDLAKKIEAEYYDSVRQEYAFSRNADGTLDKTSTVYPAIAWWNGGEGLKNAEASFRRWASHSFSTDWGLRDVAENDPFYDPISYHQGSVWPLFTGWTSIAEYRTGHVLSGYAHLMQNADQTTAQDLGAVTELLSGAFFQPFGRSTSHQLWSSAMVVTPVLRGMFGIDVDGLSGLVHLDPHLPAGWDAAGVQKLHVGLSVCSLTYRREGQRLVVKVVPVSGPAIRLESGVKDSHSSADGSSVEFLLPPVEVGLPHWQPLPGARTAQMKLFAETTAHHSLKLELEAEAGSVVTLDLRRNAPKLNLRAEGARIEAEGRAPGRDSLIVAFPPGQGYRQQTVILSW